MSHTVEEMSVAPFPRSAQAVKDDLVINEFTRTWDDTCEVAQTTRDSAGPGVYQVTNLVPKQADAARVEYPNPTLLGREGFGTTTSRLTTIPSSAMMPRKPVVSVARYTSRAAPLRQYPIWATAVATQILRARSFTPSLRAWSALAARSPRHSLMASSHP